MKPEVTNQILIFDKFCFHLFAFFDIEVFVIDGKDRKKETLKYFFRFLLILVLVENQRPYTLRQYTLQLKPRILFNE